MIMGTNLEEVCPALLPFRRFEVAVRIAASRDNCQALALGDTSMEERSQSVSVSGVSIVGTGTLADVRRSASNY